MRHRIGVLDIDVEFELTKPWTILFGPSGSGKTTILRAIAGLVHPDSGEIASRVDAAPRPLVNVVFDSSAKKCMPAHRRWTPLASQSANLFPHKSAAENVAYSIRQQIPDNGNEVDAALALFRITRIAGKYPAELSGGEAQRVNLARAAVAAERDGVLLLDEPFTGLDIALRSELMLGLQTWAVERNLCVLSVTHDVAEAFELGAEVIRIAEGKVVAQGPVEAVLAEERDRLLRQLGSSTSQIPDVGDPAEESSEPYLSG
jgi:molybdate transport system ATP-binding protein